jgi:hypothetical protein
MKPAYKACLTTGSILVLLVALLHVYIAFAGGQLYIYFGAGEEFYRLDESGSIIPMASTIVLSIIFFLFAIYGLSGAEIIRRLPFLKIGLWTIGIIFFLRGLYCFYELYQLLEVNDPILWRFFSFSIYSLVTGGFYLIGILKLTRYERIL